MIHQLRQIYIKINVTDNSVLNIEEEIIFLNMDLCFLFIYSLQGLECAVFLFFLVFKMLDFLLFCLSLATAHNTVWLLKNVRQHKATNQIKEKLFLITSFFLNMNIIQICQRQIDLHCAFSTSDSTRGGCGQYISIEISNIFQKNQ